MSIVRVGIVGIGNMGSAHTSCIADGNISGMEAVAVCDINTKALEKFSQKYPQLKCYTDYREMIDSGSIDAVVVAVPHRLHAIIGEYALKAGLHIYIEKPVDVTVSAAKRLNEAAKNSDKVFCMGFNQRPEPAFKKAREIVTSGQLGELKRSIWIVTNWYRTQAYYDSGEWRATWSGEGGGVLLNQAPHNLDLWQWICGMPTSVTAYCDVAKYHNIEVEDDVTIFTRYENGAVGTFIATTGEYPGTNRLEVSGSLGKIVVEEGKLKWWKLNEDEREFCFNSDKSFPQIDMEYEELTFERGKLGHYATMQNFADAILKGESLIAPGEEGINELTLSNAAYLSQWTGNKEIKLPFDEELFDKLLEEKASDSVWKKNTQEEHLSSGYNERWQVRW